MYRIFKVPTFSRWMKKAKLSDQALKVAVGEMKEGLIDADLGSGLIKKRVALPGVGKRSGARTLVATNKKGRWIFLFGFAKNEKANITMRELEVLRSLSVDFLNFSESEIDHAVAGSALLEVL
ncbi:MAG: type II toxin-antitoxin system RelE/ParE family toxin [Gammaproteobacteria bacterium]|nr:type II toxin-antitoxin system RelE/ParE family toxin [Gammaproteobacteria bacterium]MBP9729560.1 type II toxin-antitoxin system RelE/ParE family toxin [Gammaproteobacteria bacterium]